MAQTRGFQRAIYDFDRSLALEPDQPIVLYSRGVAKQQLGDATGAELDFAMSNALKGNRAKFN